MTTTLPKPAPEEAAPKATRRRLAKSGRAGGQLHGGPVAYLILAVFTFFSLAPLVWTAIAVLAGAPDAGPGRTDVLRVVTVS